MAKGDVKIAAHVEALLDCGITVVTAPSKKRRGSVEVRRVYPKLASLPVLGGLFGRAVYVVYDWDTRETRQYSTAREAAQSFIADVGVKEAGAACKAVAGKHGLTVTDHAPFVAEVCLA
jgi:hypothetical protein